jgi:hypothetical protein
MVSKLNPNPPKGHPPIVPLIRNLWAIIFSLILFGDSQLSLG